MHKRMAVLTCGGICPGLNDVIRSIVLRSKQYTIDRIYGIPYGFKGLHDSSIKPIELTDKIVHDIHYKGGSIIGSSREKLQPDIAIKTLQKNAYDTVFIIGGNGGNTAANELYKYITKENIPIQVIGLPKSIDNDIDIIDKCFGFDTAVEEARKILYLAKAEAVSVPNGITIVKLMGRDSGFISTYASLASGVVDICLIPELKFKEEKVIQYIHKILYKQGYCVICIAEGIDWDINMMQYDIQQYIPHAYIKTMQPSYAIRGGITTAADHIYCTKLGSAAVDAAISGKSGITVGTIRDKIKYIPTCDIIQKVKKVSPQSFEWTALHQPNFL